MIKTLITSLMIFSKQTTNIKMIKNVQYNDLVYFFTHKNSLSKIYKHLAKIL